MDDKNEANNSCLGNLFTTLNAINKAMDRKVMKQPVDFDECLKDSPRFRLQIEQSEHDISTLESLLEKVIKQCNSMVESGKAFNNSKSGLLSGIEGLIKYFDGDVLVSAPLKKFKCVLTELMNYLSMLLDQTQRSVTTTLQNFIKDDIKKVKDTKKLFDKISDDLDNALYKHAQMPRNCKTQEAEEDENIVTAMQSCFDHISLDYAFQINMLQSRKRIEVLDTVSKFVHAHFTYFHQGYDLMNDLESYMKDINDELDGLSIQFLVDKKEMEERHTLVQKRNALEKVPDHSGVIVIEGYLFKRSSNAFKTWQRRFFAVQSNQLFYQKRSKDEQTVLAEDLRLCIVKANDEVERRFCFDIVSPSKVWCLQADSNGIRDDWISTLQATINLAFNTSTHDSESEDEIHGPPGRSKSLDSLEKITPPLSILNLVRSLPGNECCADCGHPDPKWASINIGIVLCIECSGIHRSLGVHVSKVRSLTLDTWEPELLKLMSELGNTLVNSIYESKREASKKKLNQQSNRSDRETYIKAKYVQHKYVMLDTFLRTCNRLDGSIIKNLARMKGHHDQKNAHAPLQRSDSTVGKLLQGLKISFKGERPERSRSCSTDVTSDSSGSAGGDSPKMPARKRSNSKSSGDKKHKAMHVLKNFSRGKKDIDSKFHRKKSADVNVDGDSNEQSVQKTNSDLRKTSGDDSMLSVSPTGDFTSRDVIDVGASICNTDHNEADGGESLDSLVCGSPVPPIATGDGSLSEDLHPLDLSVTVRDSHPVDLSGTGRYSPRTFASKVFEKHSPDLHVDDSIPKSESTDSALSDEGVVSVGSDDMQSDDRDEDALYRDDLEKAIEVLKILHPNRLLYKAAEWKSIPLMAAAFAEGGKANWVNEDDDSKLVLHQSVLGGSLTASEYLLQNGAKINMRDCRGRSALHYAALLGQTGQACLFLKRGANQHAIDENGEDPLTIALKQMHADIVTLLRIARLNEEMKESEDAFYGGVGDVTFTDVFRDFSKMASNNPDILRRDFGATPSTIAKYDDPERQTSL